MSLTVELQDVLLRVARERERQERKYADGWTCATRGIPNADKLAVLGEEFGEVARALCRDEGVERLQEELVQVAAVAVAWAESLDGAA